MKLTLAKQEQVPGNILRYQEELEGSIELQDVLANCVHWYAVKVEGKWRFGPSKFIGYTGMTARAYASNHRNLDGRATERHLRKWFDVQPSTALHAQLREELDEFLQRYHKQLNARATITLVEETKDDSGVSVVDALVALFNSLGDTDRAEFRRRIR